MLVVVGFTAVMGANIYYVNVTGDAVIYAKLFLENNTYGVNLPDYISTGRIDILNPLFNIFVGLFTRDPRILLSLYGLLYGLLIFLSLDKTYHIIQENIIVGVNTMHTIRKQEVSAFISFILVMMYFVNPMTHMGTFRFFFSVWLFFYGWLVYTKGQTLLGTILMFMAPLIHTAFAIPVVIVAIHKYVKIPTKILFIGVILCFIVGQVLNLQDYMHFFSFIERSDKYNVYITDEAFEERQEIANKISIINVVSQYMYKYIFFGILLYSYSIIHKIKRKGENSEIVALYNFVLLFYCFAYIFMLVPSMGRFLSLANIFLLYLVGILFPMGFVRHKRILFSLISLAMLGQIYLSLYLNNISRFDIKYLFPISYL